MTAVEEKTVRLQNKDEMRLVWLALTEAAALRSALPEALATEDLRLLTGQSRAQVRVRKEYAIVRAAEVQLRHGAVPEILHLALVSLPNELYFVAPEQSEVVRRAMGRAQAEAKDAFDLFYLVWDDLVERFLEETEEAVVAAEKVSERVLIGPTRGLSHATYRVRRWAFRIRIAVARAQAAFSVLTTERPQHWGEETVQRLAELKSRISAVYEDIEAVRTALGETVEAYSSVQANDINQVMQVLTIVSALFLPPTLIASIYGMNFRIPEYAWPNGYAYSLALMFALSAILLLWARMRRLLR